jgi:hypothetical protein
MISAQKNAHLKTHQENTVSFCQTARLMIPLVLILIFAACTTAPEITQPQNEGYQLEGYWIVTNGIQESLFNFKEDGTFQYEMLHDLAYSRFVLMGTYEQIGNKLILRSATELENRPCHAIFGEYVIELVGEEEMRIDVIGNRCRTTTGQPSSILSHSLVQVHP